MNKESLEKRLKELTDSIGEQQLRLQQLSQLIFMLDGAKLECINNINLLSQEDKKKDEEKTEEEKA